MIPLELLEEGWKPLISWENQDQTCSVWFHSQPPPALRYPSYRGCLELDTLNEEVVSLYNFQHTFQVDTTAEKPCARWGTMPRLGAALVHDTYPDPWLPQSMALGFAMMPWASSSCVAQVQVYRRPLVD